MINAHVVMGTPTVKTKWWSSNKFLDVKEMHPLHVYMERDTYCACRTIPL